MVFSFGRRHHPLGLLFAVALLLSLCQSLQLKLLPNKLRQKIANARIKKENQPLRLPKAPKFQGHSRLVGIFPDFRKDAAATLIRLANYCWENNLPGVKISLGVAGSLQFVLDPALVEDIMTDRPRPDGRHGVMFKSDLDRRGVGLLAGRGSLLTDGADHNRKRRLILPSFDARSLSRFVSTMEEVSAEFARATTKSTSINVPELTSAIAMKIVGLCLFSTDVVGNNEIYHDISKCLEHVVYVTRHPFAAPQWIPTRRNRQFKRSISTLNNLIESMIQSARTREHDSTDSLGNRNTNSQDLLGMLLSARYENEHGIGEGSSSNRNSKNNDGGLTDQELRDEVMTLFLAGHETTAIALSWTLWFLSDPKHHHWQEKIVEEYDNIMQLYKGGFSPEVLQDPEAMKYTRATLCEALRLRSPTYAFDREVQLDTILKPKDGTADSPHIRIKKKEILLISPLAMHLNPTYFENPEVYDPSRFLSKEALSSTDLWDGPFDRSYYLPFGAGRKRCIGYRFAQWEMLIIMSVLMKHLKVTRTPEYQDKDIPWIPEVTLRPDRSLELMFEPRAPPASSAILDKQLVGEEVDLA